MQRKTNKPIFIVGSPRSGTSILAWCLGQHPNIFPVPESNWMGEFAVNIALSYQIGIARDNRSVLSAMDVSRDEFFANFGQSINDLLLNHRKALERKRALETKRKTKYSKSERKVRWVDGTPEYALHIYGLRKLFPEALFIHLVRDVGAVVRSMLNFHRIAGIHLVASEEEAYKYWLRMVSACLKAEQAYGPQVIYRLPYAALIDSPASAIRSLLDFVGESYSAKCLEPLAQRINSSNVPADFKSDDPATDPDIVEQAQRLSAEIEKTAQPSEGSPAVAKEMEVAFGERAKYIATSESTRQMEKSRLESAISAYQMENSRLESAINAYQVENSRLESAITELQRQREDLCSRVAQANDQISQMSCQLHDKSANLAEREKYIVELTGWLRKQLRDTRKLSQLLDNVQDAAKRLRNSRRWKLANPGTAIKAKLSRSKASTGYGHLDRIVAAYSQWRALHPEITQVDDSIEAAGSSISSNHSDAQVENLSDIQSIRKRSRTPAKT